MHLQLSYDIVHPTEHNLIFKLEFQNNIILSYIHNFGGRKVRKLICLYPCGLFKRGNTEKKGRDFL